jgi:CHAT domain-containing protein
MNDRTARFLGVLLRGSKDERLGLLAEMPPSPMKDATAFLLASDDTGRQVMALNTLVTTYGFGQAAELAGDLSRAAYRFALAVYENQGPGGPLLLPTVSAIASTGLSALNLTGHYAATVEFANEVVPELESLHDDANLPDVYAHKIEALIGLHRMDEARELVGYAAQRPKQSGHLLRLKKKIDDLMKPPTELASEARADGVAMTLDKFRELDGALLLAEQFVTKSGEEMNEWKANAVLRGVGQIFMDETNAHDAEHLAKGLGQLRPLLAWARASGHTDVFSETLWELYLCHSRMGAWSEAAAALQDLRRSVEKTRAGIADPMQRAGAGANFPHLYPALCQMLLKAGRVEELLGAMEGAKGRAVADVMAQRVHQVIDEAEFAEPAARMGELMRRNSAHYLSFFVDADSTLAVLVGKDGSLHTCDPIPLGKEQIRQASRYADPRSWGKPKLEDLTGPPVEDIAEVLSPLIAWLEHHFESGLIEDGDHVCYSPDEHLHQFPLAYVRFMGDPIVQRVSISRVHGARMLSLILGSEASRPGTFVGVEVPGRQDLSKRVMMRQLRAVDRWLGEHLPGTTYRNERATVDAICRAELAGRVVHFATHGMFPSEESSDRRNPFEHSGLALAGVDGLPDKNRMMRGEDEQNLLTPSRALEGRLDLSGSHVTLQACVTGLAREGIGGDALGLDWALFQLGASSLLTSHWYVSAKLSAELSLRFYRSWLEQKKPRATAWRDTVLGMMAEGDDLAEPYAWAAFSLSGDWR